jgi:TetR/AcrR family transcriptional regulator, transcriptional repressor for nem operon
MKVSRAEKAAHKAAMVKAAARLVRERGPDGVSVGAVTKAAGLTHGAFYGHFPDKNALLAEALAAALDETAKRLPAGLDPFAQGYLTASHVSHPGAGCAIAAVGGEIHRQSEPVQAAFADALSRFLDVAADQAGTRAKALAEISRLVGAMVMARAVAAPHPALAEEILASARGSPT